VPRDLIRLALSLVAVGLLTLADVQWLQVSNGTTVALGFLLIVLVVATTSPLWVAITTSVAAMVSFNFFFLPPVRTLTIADPQNWVALFTFLAVSLVASNLSYRARSRTEDALARRDEMTRLFDVSRDVLLMTDSRQALSDLARAVARRFDLDYAAICLPRKDGWDVAAGGTLDATLDPTQLSRVFADIDANESGNGVRVETPRAIQVNGQLLTMMPLHLGAKPIGLLAMSGAVPEAGALDALSGMAAIAIERAHFLDELKSAELARQREELKSALLSSLAHDLRTPLTAIRVAASNLQASWLTDADRRDQSDLVLTEVGRLTRLFDNILEMARIDAGAIATTQRWVHPSEIVEAARDQVGQALQRHPIAVSVVTDALVRLDPRLTAAALARLLENAAQYAPAESAIDVGVSVSAGGLEISVRDRGPGIAPADSLHLFERFFRGTASRGRATGTGMGLSIARGLLAAEQGRVWAENVADGGARFTIAVPAHTKSADPDAETA
jgi:two-component system, OmpR family, sensor histidine kinase KdpD